MRPQVLFGGVIGLALVGSALLAPYIGTSAARSADGVLADAELARRTVQKFHLGLVQFDARGGFSDPQVPFEPGAKGVAGVKARVAENENLLKAALAMATAATQSGGDVPGVAQIEGAIQYLKAGRAYAESQELHSRLRQKQAELLRLGTDWKAAQADADHYRSLDFGDTLTGLRRDLGSVAALAAEAGEQVAQLKGAVARRQQELVSVQGELESRRAEQLALETRGFEVGNDPSFEAYRSQYLALSDQLRDLQSREQALRHGVRQGAEFEDDDPAEGAMRGGEPVDGLEELQRRLAMAEERATRLTAGVGRIEERIAFVEKSQADARREEQHYQDKLAEAKTGLEALQKELAALAGAAVEREKEAIDAAQRAASAFRKSQDAIATFKRAAGEKKRDADPEGRNARLKMITGDTRSDHFGKGAQAAAQLLLGRVQAQRFAGVRNHVDVLRRFAEMTNVSVDLSKQEELAEAARDAAATALKSARDLFESVEKSAGSTSWIPQTSLAVTYHLLSQVDPDESAVHATNAAESIRKAVQGRERSPYLERAIELRSLLAADSPAGLEDDGGGEPGDGDFE